ncbi:MerR family transcriptional regulator [Solimicrobium silvestre]|uniref:Putative transcriptional regulator n=1 Tax=Solimicrobium silvestre TaxID=2099400 RepID=A0A2S9GVM8_9BURK|nr:MerR family transcriptional regulator [Solimicrobium silvestre]PRC91779.1 putative transcriptional regulator [Solimicrobium silvestre]
MHKCNYTIGQLSKVAEVGIETIRYYQRRQLLSIPAASSGAVRIYSSQFVERLRFIKGAKELGFTLDEVASLLQLNDQESDQGSEVTSQKHLKQTSRSSVRQLASDKLTQVRKKMDDLQKIEHILVRLISECADTDSSLPCPIVEAITCKIAS